MSASWLVSAPAGTLNRRLLGACLRGICLDLGLDVATWIVKLAGSWLGGYSTNVSRNAAEWNPAHVASYYKRHQLTKM